MPGHKLKAVGVDGFVHGSYRCKIKVLFALANVVFHVATVAIIVNDLPVPKFFHIGDNERVHMGHLVVGLFNLKCHTVWLTPGGCLIIELAIGDGIINRVVIDGFHQVFLLVSCQLEERVIDFQADVIFYTVVLEQVVKPGVAKPLSPLA